MLTEVDNEKIDELFCDGKSAAAGVLQKSDLEEYFEIERIFDSFQFEILKPMINLQNHFDNNIPLQHQRRLNKLSENWKSLL